MKKSNIVQSPNSFNHVTPKPILLLDYDNTLCPLENKALKAMDIRITQFIQQHLSITHKQANILRKKYCTIYGTTLEGLMIHHSLHPDEYFDFIHKIPSSDLPKPSCSLKIWLQTIKRNHIPTFIFTNARIDWVTMGLTSMEIIQECTFLKSIIDLKWLGWQGKPHASAYQKVNDYVQKIIGIKSTIFFADDSLQNLYSAKQQGWKTIWIHPECNTYFNQHTCSQKKSNIQDFFIPDLTFKTLSDVPLLDLFFVQKT